MGAKSFNSLKRLNIASKLLNLVRQPLYSNAAFILGVNVFPFLIGIVFWGLAGRLYLPSDIGFASGVISSATLVAGLAGLGIGTGLIRFLPESRNPKRLLNSAISFVLFTTLAASGLFLVGISIWFPALAAINNNPIYVIGLFFFVGAIALGTVIKDSFVARRQAHYTLIYTLITNIVRVVLLVIGVSFGSIGLIGSVVMAFIFSLLVGVLILMPKVEPGYQIRLNICWADLVDLIPFSIGNHLAILLTSITHTILPIMILVISGPVANGYAYIALVSGSALLIPGLALGRSAFAEGANTPQKTDAILAKAVVTSLLLTILSSLIFFALASWIMMLFGKSYALESTRLLQLLSLSAPFVILNQIYFTYLRLQKNTAMLILLSGVIVLVSLSLTAILLPPIGISAAGIGVLIGNALVSTMVLPKLYFNIPFMNEFKKTVTNPAHLFRE